MKKITNSKTLLKILSAIIAIVLWFAITYTEDPVISQSLTGLNLTISGETELNSNGLAITNKEDFPSLSVVISGNRSSVISALGEISAEIDVSRITEAGENLVTVKYSYPANSVILEKIKVKEFTVVTESIVSREIPVKIEAVNAEKNSNILVKSECDTKTVFVKGAGSDVYEMAYAKAKIDVSKITKTSGQECAYVFYNENDDALSAKNITYKSKDTLLIKNTAYDRVTLPIKVVVDGEKKQNFGFAVKTMSADNIDVGFDDGITAEYIEAVITLQMDKGGYEATLVAPDGVYIPEENSKITVTGDIVPKDLKEITLTVEPVNVPKGALVTIVPKEQKITVKTIEAPSDITAKATVDVSKMSSSEEILPVNITADGDIDIMGTYSVTVKLEYEE